MNCVWENISSMCLQKVDQQVFAFEKNKEKETGSYSSSAAVAAAALTPLSPRRRIMYKITASGDEKRGCWMRRLSVGRLLLLVGGWMGWDQIGIEFNLCGSLSGVWRKKGINYIK